jgi:hypothetical protein
VPLAATRRRPSRPGVASFFAAILLAVSTAPVAGVVVPGDELFGDDLAAPIEIASSDFGVPQPYDTTGATTNSATDPTACEGEFGTFEGPFTETVWHTFTPDESGELIVDVNSFPGPEDGFLAILFVFADDGAGGVTDVGCSAFPATVRFEAEAGTTYFAMTGTLPEADNPPGGPALITVAEPILTDLVVDARAGYDPQTDELLVTGTVQCNGADSFSISVDARQTIGRHTVTGFGFADQVECDGEVAWAVSVTGNTSPFNPGAVDVFVAASACAAFCTDTFADASVRARPVSNRPAPPPPPPPPAPDNDEPAGALPLALGATAEQDVEAATPGAGDPGECPGEGTVAFSGHTVWYEFAPAADGWVEASTVGSDYDTTLFVLSGDEIVACDDDIQLGITTQSMVTFFAETGTTYLLMAGAWESSAPGHLVLFLAEGTEPEPPPPAPPNDERVDAAPLAVGETLAGDTSGATANFATDPAPGACPFDFSPFADHTVWYTVTPAASGWIQISTVGSAEGADGMLHVFDAGESIACGATQEVVFFGEAGVTYEVMVGTFPGPPGGALTISASPGDPPLTISITIDPSGTVRTKTGEATVSGTVTCSEPAFADISVFASQSGGRFVAEGSGFAGIECGPDPTAWSVAIPGETDKFQVGTISVGVDSSAFTDAGEDAFTHLDGEVQLSPGKP